MSKKTFLIALLAFFGTIVNAQNVFKFGVAGGLNLSKINSEESSKSITGFHGGLITEIKLPIELGVEVDVLYSTKGGTFEGLNSKLETVELKNELTYIDIPVVAKLYILKVLNLQAGPQFSYLMGAKFDGTDNKENLNSIDLGIVAGIGLDITKLHTAVRYNYGLTEIGAGGGKNNMIQLSVGFWIK